MSAQDIAYIELYTADDAAMVDYFVSAMGFTRTGHRPGTGRGSVHLAQGDVRLVVTSGQETWGFLDRHGDGVADIALACDDVDATRDAALAAGGRPADSANGTASGAANGAPAVLGFGGVRHTLLPAPPSPRPTSTGRSRPDPAGERIRLLDHVAVCLEGGTLDQFADFYRDAFGLARYSSEYVDVGGQAMDSIVVRGASGGITFTLVAPDPAKGSGQLDAFLERNGGPGVQHLAFLTDEIVPAVRELRARGVEFLETPGSYYDMLQERFTETPERIAELRDTHVLADRDEWGYLLQLFSRSPYERDTLFYELIQRRGSRGFGSANIRALYEAVERDRQAAL
ncbi:4-hydroxyphenylpyruvate dioxygenase [Streptomyces daliensis]|uniref:4-hydroxyphenylpyruvate dioxygenase n=1 Tax=Streptomyces daliensis TaxID=299421 RepID=A0A8T4J5M1_9ACTN|nr:4-hydroxyphenylpyruvate dioxygenase [Streptomyces daliensis]